MPGTLSPAVVIVFGRNPRLAPGKMFHFPYTRERSMPERRSPTPAEITIIAAGGVMVVFSFLDFAGAGRFAANAWGKGLFPIATLLPLYGLVMALQIALTRLASVELPAVAGFTWEQIHLALASMAALMAIGFLATDTGDKKIGQWIEILGAIALVVGAVLLQRERATGATG
jgi:hypothetical protein